MTLTVEAMRLMSAKGLSLDDVIEIAAAMEPVRSSAAERQKKYRDKQRNNRDVTRDVTPPNDIYSNPENPSEAKASPSPSVEIRLVEAWNAGPGANGARKAAKLDTSRKNLLRSRLKDHGEDEVFAALRNLGRSKFHCGDNDRGWRANLGWFLEAKNFLKALEMDEAKPAPGRNGKVLTSEEQRAYVEHVAQKFGRMSPSAPSPTERIGKPITLASLASAQIEGRH